MNGQLIPFRILYAGNLENQKEDTADSLLFWLVINYFPDRISFYLFFISLYFCQSPENEYNQNQGQCCTQNDPHTQLEVQAIIYIVLVKIYIQITPVIIGNVVLLLKSRIFFQRNIFDENDIT